MIIYDLDPLLTEIVTEIIRVNMISRDIFLNIIFIVLENCYSLFVTSRGEPVCPLMKRADPLSPISTLFSFINLFNLLLYILFHMFQTDAV